MTFLRSPLDLSALASPEPKGDGWAFAGQGLYYLNHDRMARPEIPNFSPAIDPSSGVSTQPTRLINAPRSPEDPQIPIARSLTSDLG